MADIASRAFKNGKYFKAANDLTSYFNTHFTLPQGLSWTECILPSKLVSRVTSCLLGELSPLGSLQRLPGIEKNTGGTGDNMLHSANVIHSSQQSLRSNEKSLFPPSLQGSGLESTAMDIKSRFKQSRTHSRPSQRPLNWLDN